MKRHRDKPNRACDSLHPPLIVLILLSMGWLPGCTSRRLSTILHPSLVSILDLKGLPDGHHVELRGTVTYSDPATGFLYMQDSTAAVKALAPGYSFRPGQRVRLEGATSGSYDSLTGLQSVTILAGKIEAAGQTRIPAAEKASIKELFAATKKAPVRVEGEGIVRSVQVRGDYTILDSERLFTSDTRFRQPQHIWGAFLVLVPARLLPLS